MRCPQCGTESQPQAAFCSRCGVRFTQPKPAAVREYSIALIRRSYWYYLGRLIFGAILVGVGVWIIFKGPQGGRPGLGLILVGLLLWVTIPLAHRSTLWRVTSD